MDGHNDATGRMPETLTLVEAARFFAGDLANLSDAQLAQALLEIARMGPDPLGATLAPLAQGELDRRRSAAVAEHARSSLSRDVAG
jgi:hypothetical protein